MYRGPIYHDGEYKFKVIKHDIFGEIRTAIINDEIYYSTKDIAKMLGEKYPSISAYKHLLNEDVVYIQFQVSKKKYKTVLKMVPMENALLLVSRIQTDKAKEILRWLIKIIAKMIK